MKNIRVSGKQVEENPIISPKHYLIPCDPDIHFLIAWYPDDLS